MNNEIRWKQRFQNFDKAYQTFCRTLERYETDTNDEIFQMALVQAFEFTFELAWNTMKDYLENEGYDAVTNRRGTMHRAPTIRTAFQAELITDAEKWMDVIQKRNLASHTYNSVILKETVNYIQNEFYPLAGKLYEDFKKKL